MRTPGSSSDRNSTEPTAVAGSMGVNKKWFLGDMMSTQYFSMSTTCTPRVCDLAAWSTASVPKTRKNETERVKAQARPKGNETQHSKEREQSLTTLSIAVQGT